jgi:hypothetical protein
VSGVGCPVSAGLTTVDRPDPAAERHQLVSALTHHDHGAGTGCAEMQAVWGSFAAARQLMRGLIASGVLMMAEEPDANDGSGS